MRVVYSILDVSPHLGGLAVPKSIVSDWNDFENLNENTTGIVVASNSCNEGTILDFDLFESLQYLHIGSECFKNVTTFNINGLSKLNMITIGSASFTSKSENTQYSFRILDCDSLLYLEIGYKSFQGYTATLELSHLPSLERINIGLLHPVSTCFSKSNLYLQG